MTLHEILETVAHSLIVAGLYKNEESAIKAMAIEQIERKIISYREQVSALEKKHHLFLEEYSRHLEGKATMEEEDEWMEWKGAAVMLEAWQKSLQEMLSRAI